MKLSYGSKRLDFAREVFYWATFLKAFDKLDNYTYGMLVGAVVVAYLGNRVLTDNKVPLPLPAGK